MAEENTLEAKEARSRDRFSPHRIEKVQKFMKFCQETLSTTEYSKSAEIRKYSSKIKLGPMYLNCMVGMGWIEMKGTNKGAQYKWKASINTIDPIHARKLITCVNEQVDKYRVTVSVANNTEEKTQEVQQAVEQTTKVEMEQPLITEKVVKERKPKSPSSQKTVELTEVTYFWGLFRRTIKKEIQ